MKNVLFLFIIILSCLAFSCKNNVGTSPTIPNLPPSIPPVVQAQETIIGDPLPAPYATKSANHGSSVIGWPTGKSPIAPNGFTVTRYAENLKRPRWIYIGPNNDVFISEASTDGQSGNDVLLFRDTNQDGKPDENYVFLSKLNKPFGMLILNGFFYMATTDGVWKYPYSTGQNTLDAGSGVKILDLPAGGYNNHWTRNLLASQDGSKIYVTVGSGSNAGENGMNNEIGRACILQINPDGTGKAIYASGLRNPNGMDWAPGTNQLWTAVNERDGLGDDLVPDYITHVKEGGFYGWPYSYYGKNIDNRVNPQDTALVSKAIVPNVQMGSHTACLGLAFYTKTKFPIAYQGGAFIGQHGSWNRSVLAGYKVSYIPFLNGQPISKPQDFLTGFIADLAASKVYGRPVDVAVLPDGSLLVSDDGGNIIWRVAAN